MWPLALKGAGLLWKAAPVIGYGTAAIGGIDYVRGLNAGRRDEKINTGAGPDGRWDNDDFTTLDRILGLDPTWFGNNAEQYRQSLPIVQKYEKYGMPGLAANQSVDAYKALYEKDVENEVNRIKTISDQNLEKSSPQFELLNKKFKTLETTANQNYQLAQQKLLNEVNQGDKDRLHQLNILDTRSRNDALQWQKQMEYMDRKDYARDRADRMKLLIAGLSQLGASFAA